MTPFLECRHFSAFIFDLYNVIFCKKTFSLMEHANTSVAQKSQYIHLDLFLAETWNLMHLILTVTVMFNIMDVWYLFYYFYDIMYIIHVKR